MKLYRVHFYTEAEGSQGFEWFANRATAQAAVNKFMQSRQDEFGCDADEFDDSELTDPLETEPPVALSDPLEVELVFVPAGKADLINFLNSFASHADNG